MIVNQWFDEFCAGDRLWDSNLTWNTTSPHLTRCFRTTILIWIPAAFLWLFVPLEGIFIARSRARLTPWNAFNVSRIISVGICILLSLFDCIFCIYRYLHKDDHPPASDFCAPFVTFATFLLLDVILIFHRWRGIHTSGVVWIFSLLALVCGFPTIYMYCFLERPEYIYEFVSYLIYYSMVIVLFLLSCFADSPPKYSLTSTESEQNEDTTASIQQNCPEIEASFLSKITYWWFNGLAITGYRKGIVSSDLWNLKDEDKTNTIAPKFDKNWLKQISYSSKYQKENQKLVSYHNDEAKIQIKTTKSMRNPGTIKTLIKTFGLYFISGAVFKLFHDILQFVSPQLLKVLIGFVSKPSYVEPVWHGFFIAVLLFVTAMVQSVMLNYYFQVMFEIGMRVRTALISAIYRKSLNLSNSARKGTTSGEIVNLMSVDAQRFVDLLTFINLVWSAPLQIFLAMYFLWLELGPSVLAGLLVMILMLPLNALLAGYQRKLQIKQMKQKDERVKTMNEILSGIRVIKLYAWEKSFMKNVFKIRNIELANLKHMAYLGCATTFLWTCAPFLVALVTFAIYVLIDDSHILDAQKAFVSLALFNLLRFPLTMLPQMITFIVMTAVSVKRLNKFFNSSQLEKYVTRNEEMDAITVENGTFTWETKDESETDKNPEIPVGNTLIDINLHVPKGSLVAVVGTVGSGKSSLISALLGEMDRVMGRVNINGSSKVAYVSQQAWIQNATLKQNILFGMKYDRQKYDSVINACALSPDLAILPGGDETEIGEKGINLSGGQKQRVAIARACYSDSDIVLLDDPLSAVDSHVAKHIFEKVLSNKKGVLKDKTRLLITNNLNFLSEVDSIVVLKNGRINEIGTYDELMENKGDFCEFINEFSSDRKESNGPLLARQESVISDKFSRSLSVEKEKEVENQTKLIENEKTETGKVKFSVYVRYFKSLTWIWLFFLLLGMIGMQIASVGSNVWLALWSSDKPRNGTQDIELRNMRLGVYGALGAAQAFLVLLAAFAMAKGTVIASRTLHNSLLERILRSPMSFFDTTPLGRIVNRFSKDIDTVDSTIPHTIRGWLLCLLQVVSTFILIGSETPMFLVVILPVALLYYFIQKFYVSTSRQLKRLESVTRSPIYSHFSETLSGVSTIRAYGATRRFITESNSRVDYNQVCYYPSVCANRWLAIRLEFCGNCIILFAAIFAVLDRDNFRENPGFVGLILTYALSVTQTLNWLVRMTSEMETNIVSVERIAEYCDNPTEAEWVSDESNRPSKEWPTNGAIKFIDYSVRYRAGLDLVLRDISTKIEPQEKIGIVGRTGAGKSSLTLSLFRIIEGANGKIIIDDIDISQIGLHDLRSRLTVIPQDPVLFSGTIRSNLDPFEIYSDTQIWTALEHSHLKHYIKGLEAELEYKVAEGGENLSVGQRQLICLARALLRKTKILVLDEATAAVDLETDSLIQTTIRKEFKECTILTIAHRLNTIMDSNRVLVLDKGTIGEFDSPSNLLSDHNSIFYSLAKDARLV